MATNASTPLLHLRALLRRARAPARVRVAVDVLFAVTFACVRLVLPAVLLTAYARRRGLSSALQLPRVLPLKCSVGTLCILALNAAWACEIGRRAAAKLLSPPAAAVVQSP